jgi:ABC-type dipeptide/oligopeptide/nickel transport system ATPase component
MSNSPNTILKLEGLTVEFDAERPGAHRALDRVSLSIGEGEVVALVGESGSGKTVLAHAIMGLLPAGASVTAGRILWNGEDLLTCSRQKLRSIRGGQIGMIFQDAQASLNPVYAIRDQFRWVLKLHRGMAKVEADAEARRLLLSVQLDDHQRILSGFAHQLSGGMAQRVMIALVLACAPRMIVADEPTSALDRIVQSEIVQLLRSIHRDRRFSMLMITHDLGMARGLASRVAVIRGGELVEQGTTKMLFAEPGTEYTRKLIAAAELAPAPA